MMEYERVLAAVELAHQNADAYLADFETLLRFPSVSQEARFRPQLEACADWLAAEMERIGLENCRKLPTAGHPVVYGDWLHAGADRPTVLFYAHYDVQPAGDAALWRSPPFEPTRRGGRLVARGTVDDKCGIWVNLKALESTLRACGGLPINVKLFFEGEEELGSRNTGAFVAGNRDLLAADALMLCDGPFSPRQPLIGYAVRGTIMGELRVKGPKHDLHSGRYGGAVQNPIHHLAAVIGSFHSESGRVQIPGFYDGVLPLSSRQRRHLDAVWRTAGAAVERGAGVAAFWGEGLGSFAERTTCLPTLDVNGIYGGWQGEGTRAVIPAEAGCKVTIRTVPQQRSEAVWQRFAEYVDGFDSARLSVSSHLLSMAHPFLMADEGREIRAIQAAFAAVLGRSGLLMRHGGSLPIGGLLQRELQVPVAMLGYGAGDYSHAPNEYVDVRDLQSALDVAIHLLFELARAG